MKVERWYEVERWYDIGCMKCGKHLKESYCELFNSSESRDETALVIGK